MRFPVNQPYRITTKFSSGHPGIDIAPTPAGTKGIPCYAPEAGTIVSAAYRPSLEGNYVILKGKTKYYYFGHFAGQRMRVGQVVKEGQIIGILGQTGLATGIHTHHEVRTTKQGGQINPEVYYKGEDMYTGMFEGKKQTKSAKGWYDKAVHYRKRTIEEKGKLAKAGEYFFNQIKKVFGK